MSAPLFLMGTVALQSATVPIKRREDLMSALHLIELHLIFIKPHLFIQPHFDKCHLLSNILSHMLSIVAYWDVTHCTDGVLRCHLSTASVQCVTSAQGSRRDTWGPEKSRCTQSRHIPVLVCLQNMCKYAERRDGILDYLLFFFNIFSLPKRNSKRCEGKTENSNRHWFELHSPSIEGTKLLFKVIKSINIIYLRNFPTHRPNKSMTDSSGAALLAQGVNLEVRSNYKAIHNTLELEINPTMGTPEWE